ncbi:MAG: PhoU domain-containing protein [Phycisphaerales bacterium]|jgi:phosphate uptake regulator|nr:PhoU domain-containing protein [Phycisphaerales bacterium]
MFGQLIAALKSGDQLEIAFSEFLQMIDAAEWMFHEANDVLRGKKTEEAVGEPLYNKDQEINQLLRSVRISIVTHLSVNPVADIPGCLALMSVAKDAERIGDYCKNVFEVGRYYEDDYSIERYHDPLEDIRKRTGELFKAVHDAFEESSVKKAKASIKAADRIRGECDAVEETLLRDRREVKTHVAVAYSLLARHYKRVASHLANISTAVFGRIEDLDFRKPKKAKESAADSK